ncbi:MAG: MCP four helix bundle domain-containing protein [Desulfovibrio sp.]|nr:MCP four helix bundle domain-containing protein [Desulfovibrio sp.]
MRSMKIGLRLVSGFIIVSLIGLAIGAAGIVANINQEKNLTSIGDIALPYSSNLALIKAELMNIRAIQRTMLIKDLEKDVRARQKETLAKARESYAASFSVIEKLQLTQEDKKNLEELKSYMGEWRTSNEQFFKLNDAGDFDKMNEIAMKSGREAQTRAINKMDEIINHQTDKSKNLVIEAQKSSHSMTVTVISMVVVGLVLSIALGLILTRGITKPLSSCVGFATDVANGNLDNHLTIPNKDETGTLADSLNIMVANLKSKIDEANEKSRIAAEETEKARLATQEAQAAKEQAERAKAEGMLQAAHHLEGVVEIVTSASEELSAQIEQSSRGSEEQSNRVSETATAMEEMNATVLEVAKSASSAAETADQAKAKAEEGYKVVSQVVKGIGDVQRQSQEMKVDMDSLGKQAEGIGQIMNVISDIADQTNLLALNAAIEAARAGEAGRGFAVVADEVRKLAEKTMTATKEVGDAIKGIQEGTRKNSQNVERSGKTIEEATELANRSGESLNEIVSLVETTSDQVRSIATASEQQSSASEEINHSIEDVNRISSETSDAMRQSAQAVGELANQALILKNLIEQMKEESGAGTGARVKALPEK